MIPKVEAVSEEDHAPPVKSFKLAVGDDQRLIVLRLEQLTVLRLDDEVAVGAKQRAGRAVDVEVARV
jgi:hypothetical protein